MICQDQIKGNFAKSNNDMDPHYQNNDKTYMNKDSIEEHYGKYNKSSIGMGLQTTEGYLLTMLENTHLCITMRIISVLRLNVEICEDNLCVCAPGSLLSV